MTDGQRRLMELLAAFVNYARERTAMDPAGVSVFTTPTQYEYEALLAENMLLDLRRAEGLTETDIRLYIMGTLQKFIVDGVHTSLKG